MSEQSLKAEEVLKRVQKENETVLNELQENGKVDDSLKLTLLKEIDPANDKLLGLEIGEILEDVDLAKGSEDFREGRIEEALNHSGIKYIYNRIKHYLIESNIAENVFVEYSLLPSTLDPQSTGKLQCMSFLVGEDGFKERIKNYYTSCIAQTRFDHNDISIYDHPDFLYNIPIKNVRGDIEENIDDRSDIEKKNDNRIKTLYNGRGLRISKIGNEPERNVGELGKISGKESKYEKLRDIEIGAFDLDRSFDEMLSTAKRLAEEQKNLTEVEKEKYSLTTIHEKLHCYCHENISKRDGLYHKSVYVSFPIFGARADNQLTRYKIGDGGNTALQGIGACFIYFEPNEFSQAKSEESVRTKVLDRIIGKITYEICTFIRFASANYLLNLGLQLQDKARKEALKSAKSAIMSRNMSHNIGSHVMSYLKQHLGSVKDIIADGILSNLINGETELARKLENTTENTTLPFLMGLGHFISYMQERQDFIATIATDYIPYFGNVNFKDAIYDELNPDKRAERHSERKNGKTDNILLGNIARSEGLGRKTTIAADARPGAAIQRDIVLKFRERFCGNPVVEMDSSGNIKNKIDEQAFDELEEMRKYDFSLPGGVVGRQAFFSIMENVIRNAAKHGNWRNQENLEFTFDIFSCKDKDLERLREHYSNDNVDDDSLSLYEVIERFYLNASDAKDLYFITITDNCDFAPLSKTGDVLLTPLGALRNALVSYYINSSGEMKNENKGLKEMRISAAWMRAIKDEAICFCPYSRLDGSMDVSVLEHDKYPQDTDCWKTENLNYKAPLLYARISTKKVCEDEEEIIVGRNLQFIFCVQIPRKVAVILQKDESEIEEINKNIVKINWRAYSVVDFDRERNRSYEFILVDDKCNDIEQIYFKIRSEATLRTYRFSEIKGLVRDDFVERLKDDNYNGEDDLRLFYRSLSDYHENEQIIVDDKTAAAKKNVTTSPRIKVVDGYSGSDAKYIYRRHHEAEIEFTAFMRSKMIGSVEFVEGITGNNSTDRLVRNENLDDSWFYRHLHAMKQKIAIFDERLFSKITGLEENDFNNSDVVLSKDNTALAYVQRGIYPFTFVVDRINRSLKLMGILFTEKPVFEESVVVDDPQAPIHSYRCKCGCIASVTFNDEELEFVTSEYGKYIERHFHAITIHQGLLDKIYELFGIKGDKQEREKKINITGCLFKALSALDSIALKSEGIITNEFFPGIVIHSGRSKPNDTDMPQKIPFIQYAALEHAVMDCKYSLVELLDFARYEN